MVYALDIRTAFPPAKLGGQSTTLATILDVVIPMLTIVGALLFLAMGLYGAFTMLTAGGDPEKVQKAQQIFKTSVIGLVIVLAAFTIVKVITKMFNINAPI